MAPNPWLTFTLFGIPFVIGLLSGVRSARLLWRAYRRHTRTRVGVSAEHAPSTADDPDYSLREQVLRGVGLLVVSVFLLAHSGRWLLSVYGYL